MFYMIYASKVEGGLHVNGTKGGTGDRDGILELLKIFKILMIV